nr:MAG TPA: hypothetical protein [Herelleviridae sp.]
MAGQTISKYLCVRFYIPISSTKSLPISLKPWACLLNYTTRFQRTLDFAAFSHIIHKTNIRSPYSQSLYRRVSKSNEERMFLL